MAKPTLEDIKKNLKTDKLVVGTQSTMKNLRLKKLSTIFISSNAPEDVVDDIEHYAKMAETDVVRLDIPNDELGVFCKKPYSISVIGLAG